ncbi:MAG: prepilin-type N-terminal cleavage/methylation domain-containing protein [Gemmatimonadaceae bacterium]
MKTRAGFTLMEVMTALTITALLATLAASSLRAAMDVRERVQTHRTTTEAEARAIAWIGTMLRHAPLPSSVDEALLRIDQASFRAAGGESTDALTFLSQGVEAPIGSGQIWRVTLAVQNDGLHVTARPVNVTSNRIPLETVLPHVNGLLVEALDVRGGPGNTAVWRRDWPVLRTMPTAVRLTLSTSNGERRDPLVFDLAPLNSVALTGFAQ